MTNGPSQVVDLDALFVAKASLTLAHLIPGAGLDVHDPFSIFADIPYTPFESASLDRSRDHAAGLVVGISGLALLKNPVGGVAEVTAILFFDALFLVALAKAYAHARRRAIALHREWVIRAMSVAVGVGTVRPVMGAFFCHGHAHRHDAASVFWHSILGWTNDDLYGRRGVDKAYEAFSGAAKLFSVSRGIGRFKARGANACCLSAGFAFCDLIRG